LATADLAAKRYAQAAFEVAQEKGTAPAWSAALDQIGEFMSDPEVAHVLTNTRVLVDAKQRLVETALAGIDALALNLARLLVKKGRTPLAADIATEFKRLTEEQQGISRARAVTAVAMSDAERQALTQRLQEQTGGQVLLETEVDASLIGGLVLQIGDRMIDSSTRARLEALRESLVGAV
jgi:F-type H+-transporting ATPase subunit delta